MQLRLPVCHRSPADDGAILGTALLVALTIVAYVPFVSAGFAATDSLPLVETSRFATLAQAAQQFTQPVMAGTRFTAGELVYRPFVSFTFGLDHLVWGLDPRGYHVTNLVLHIVGVLSVYVLLVRAGLRAWSANAGAALFALHPVVLASVPVIARRDSVLPVVATTAAAAVLIAADQAHSRRRTALLLAALVLTLAALLSKESAFLGVLLMAMLFVAGGMVRDARPFAVLGRLRTLVPFFLLAAIVFGLRLWVLGALGGGSESLVAIDLDKYSQTIGAFTRDLAWVFAGLASSTRDVWPRAAALTVAGLFVTGLALPRLHRVLLWAGGLWVVAFALFAAILKISTVAWLAYFSLVGLSLVLAAGLEGAVLGLRQSSGTKGWRLLLAQLLRVGLLLVLSAYALSALTGSPLIRRYDQWQIAGDVTTRFTAAVNECVGRAPTATRVVIDALPSTLEDGRVETNLMGVTLLEDYTVEAALRIGFPTRPLTAIVDSYETLRGAANTIQTSCAVIDPGGVRLTTRY